MAIYWIDDQQLPLAMRQWKEHEAENDEPVSTRWGVMTDFSGYVPRNKPIYRPSVAVVAAACFGTAMWIGIIRKRTLSNSEITQPAAR